MKKATIILIAICSMLHINCMAHSGFDLHKADFYAVLGFEENPKVTAWMRQISSKMIDGYKGVELPEYNGLDFYNYLKTEFPGFKCKHRLLFHWGYNSRPWNDGLQAKVDALPWGRNPEEVKRFQQAIINEQQRRNREANAMTETLFGFASGGKDAAYANAMISIVYDVHLIGDYTPDNKDFDGVQDISSVIGDLINAIRRIDETEGRQLIKSIQSASQKQVPVQEKAENLLDILRTEMPSFLQKAQDGSLKRRFAKQGIRFRISTKAFIADIGQNISLP